MASYDPSLFPRMAFLKADILQKEFYEKVSADKFEEAPISSGHCTLDAIERDSFVRLKRHNNYRGDAPEFETVTLWELNLKLKW